MSIYFLTHPSGGGPLFHPLNGRRCWIHSKSFNNGERKLLSRHSNFLRFPRSHFCKHLPDFHWLVCMYSLVYEFFFWDCTIIFQLLKSCNEYFGFFLSWDRLKQTMFNYVIWLLFGEQVGGNFTKAFHFVQSSIIEKLHQVIYIPISRFLFREIFADQELFACVDDWLNHVFWCKWQQCVDYFIWNRNKDISVILMIKHVQLFLYRSCRVGLPLLFTENLPLVNFSNKKPSLWSVFQEEIMRAIYRVGFAWGKYLLQQNTCVVLFY